MANAPTNPPATPFKFDEAAFQKAVIDQETYLQSFIGKKSHNPFFQLNAIGKLRERYAKGERSQELFDATKAFKQEAPIFGNPVVVPPAATPEAKK